LNTVSYAVDFKGGSASATKQTPIPTVFFDFQKACTFNASLTYNIADTRGLRTGKAILVDNTGAKEEVFIASFVTDVSFTISKALTVLTPANITKVLFWGMHNVRTAATNATLWRNSYFLFEPLPIEESILQKRISTDTFNEIVQLEQSLGSTAGTTLQPYQAPLHSNGEFGGAKSTDVVLLTNSIASGEKLNLRMKAFVPTAGSAAKVVNVKSSRTVVKNFDHRVRG
jgi:hypothetical protein